MPEEQWVDVTKALKAGLACMKLGETVHVSDFASEQAMTAIHIGDPRMDSPITQRQHLPSCLESGALRTDLSFAETAQLLDSLLARLAHWLCRHASLQTTLYTSLHLINQDKLQDAPVLRAGMAIVSGIISLAKQVVLSSGVIHVRPTFCECLDARMAGSAARREMRVARHIARACMLCISTPMVRWRAFGQAVPRTLRLCTACTSAPAWLAALPSAGCCFATAPLQKHSAETAAAIPANTSSTLLTAAARPAGRRLQHSQRRA